MSFVYAEKTEDSLEIHCDTKIGLDDYAGATFSHEQAELVRQYGIVKITIICPEIAVAFAGNNVYLAAQLFNQLYEKRFISTEDVVELAYNIHIQGNINDIEFIVASCENDILSISCIKDFKVYRDCQFAWIGSPVAHREFQVLRNNCNNGIASDRTASAFLDVVQGCSDNSVGGFPIVAGYSLTDKAMEFRNCYTIQSSKSAIVSPGETIPFFLTPEDGGFSFEQRPVSIEDLILDIDQIDSAVLYTRRLRMCDADINNPQLFSLMLPMLIRQDDNGNWIRC